MDFACWFATVYTTGYRRYSTGNMCYYLQEPAAGGSDSSVPPLVFVHGVGMLFPTTITPTHYMFMLAF
jgi:hypothetical protein